MSAIERSDAPPSAVRFDISPAEAASLRALSGVELLARCREAQPLPPAAAELVRRITVFLEDDGGRRLAALLRLPETATRLRLLRRNTWLARAAAVIPAANSWQGCIALEQAWARYIKRGSFARTRSLPLHPTVHERSLEACLFHATAANGGRSLTRSRLYQIETLRSVWGVEVAMGSPEQLLLYTKGCAR